MRNKDVLRQAGWLIPLALAIPMARANCNQASCELRVKVTSQPAFAEAAVSATRELVLGERVQVLDGKNFGLISNLGDSTILGAHSRVGGAFAGGRLTLGEGSSIAGDIHARSVLPESRATERKRLQSPTAQSQFMAWKVQFPVPAQAAVLLAPSKALAVQPGYYRELKVNTGAVATLHTGTYYFDSLTVARGARLRLDDKEGTVVVHVRDYLLHEGAFEYTAARSDLLIDYLGSRRVDINGKFDATLLAPSAPVVVRAASGAHEGMFHADLLRVENDAVIRKTTITGRGSAMARLRTQSQQDAEQLANVVTQSDERNGGLPFPDTPEGRILNEAFMNLGELGPDADAAHADAARQLHDNAEAVMPLLVTQYDALPETLETQTRRLTLVEMMRLTSHEVAYEPLMSIATSPVSPALRAMSDDHARPTMYEDIIRARAVNGLGNAARAGSTQATAALLEFAVNGSGLQQLYAAREYLAGGDRQARSATLRSRLPPAQQYLAGND